MEHTNISLSYGIHRTPSIGHDGELSECVNLIPRAGELVNIARPGLVADIELPDGALLQCVHHITGDQADNYISYNASTGALYTQRPGDATPATPFATLTGISQLLNIGNTIIALGEGITNFYLWKNGGYLNLGSHIPDIPIQFGLNVEFWSEEVVDIAGFSMNDNLRFYQEDFDALSRLSNPRGQKKLTKAQGQSEAEFSGYLNRMNDFIKGLLYEEIAKITSEDRFALPFFVRYALRLYDGSHAMASSPVLMLPSTIPLVEINSDRDKASVKYLKKSVLDYAASIDSGLSDLLEDWSDIIAGVDIFASNPIYMWDASEEIDTMISGSYVKDYYGVGPMRVTIGLDGYRSKSYDMKNGDEASSPWRVFFELPGLGGESGVNERLAQESTYYKISSINIDSLSTSRVSVPISSGVIKALSGQEILSDNYREHDIYNFGRGLSYNSRAILYNAARTPGYPNIQTKTLVPYTSMPPYSQETATFQIYADIKDKDGNEKRMPLGAEAPADSEDPASYWVYIPDEDITWIHYVLRYNGGEYKHKEKAIKHKFLPGVYCILPIKTIDVSTSWQGEDTMRTDEAPIFPEFNRIFISDALNPFLIRETLAVTLDVGAILAVSTATKALSQGQFGQFPLYAFTTDGIWALEVSSTGAIEARQPVSRDVITAGTLPLQTDDSVIFVTSQGLKQLTGSQTTLLSDIVEGHNPDDTDYRLYADRAQGTLRADYADLNALLTPSDDEDFVALLQSGKMLYDYAQQLVHIYVGLDKHYVYDLAAQEWSSQYLFAGDIADPDAQEEDASSLSALTRRARSRLPLLASDLLPADDPATVVPAYPLSVMQYGTRLFTYERSKSVTTHPGVALTRPIALGDPTAMKALMDFRITGQKTSADTFRRMAVYVSNDGYQWRQLPTLKRGSFKYFRFMVLSRMTDYDTLTGLTVAHQSRRLNRLR